MENERYKRKKKTILIWTIILAVIALACLVVSIVMLKLTFNPGESLEENPQAGIWFVLIFVGIFMGVFAGAIYRSGAAEAKFEVEIENFAAGLGENATVMKGKLVIRQQEDDAALKTGASAALALASAAIVGVGVFTAFSTDSRRYFVVTDDGLYVINHKANEITPDCYGVIGKGKFNRTKIDVFKDKIVMRECATDNEIVLQPFDKATDLNEVAKRLEALLQAAPKNAATVEE